MGMLLSRERAAGVLRHMASDFACIENPAGTFPPREVVPLGPVYRRLSGPPAAVLLDMDGTVTQTEPLFLHGVEAVVRRVTGWATQADWPGLDPTRDYPHIVGFSTLRNLEYLYEHCADAVKPALFFHEVLKGLQFLHSHDSPQQTVRWLDEMTVAYGLEAWRAFADGSANEGGEHLVREAVARFPRIDQGMFSHLGLVVFHADYIETLERINRGHGADVSQTLYGRPDIPAVAPMPGIALLCALVKGWIPPAASRALADTLVPASGAPDGGTEAARTLEQLSKHFQSKPIPVGLVTSSGTHEVALVLSAVFKAMTDQVAEWPMTGDRKALITKGFRSYAAYFDAVVTCDDVAGGRTKPFRDPYTLALAKLGLEGTAIERVIGFEDTEAGIIAQRGAGIGLPCAVPMEFTLDHDFSAAAHVLHGGVPDALFGHGLFLP